MIAPPPADTQFRPLHLFESGSTLGTPRKLRMRSSREIQASPINIGYECLDRDMWDREKAFPQLAETGVKWARVQTGWGRCELADGVFSFAWLDEIVDELIGIGVQPWFNVTYGNRLHTAAPAPDAVGWAPVYSESAARAWRRFVRELTKHFRDRVRHYEVWNEPDIRVFWKGVPPDPLKYAELVAITAEEIRRLHPDAVIIGGALSRGVDQHSLEFLERALGAGMGRHVDVISYHCYRPRPEGLRARETLALRAMLARHRLNPRIWQGEGGCPSEMSKAEAMAGIPWTEEKQAKWLLRQMIVDLDQEVELTSHFHLSDFHNYFNDGPGNRNAYFGLLRLKGHTRKPSYFAFQSLCNLFDSDTRIDRELQCRLDVDETTSTGAAPKDWMLTQVVPFVRRGQPLLAFWYPAELNPERYGQLPFQAGRVTITLTRKPGMELKDPVLIDLVNQQAYCVTAKTLPFPYAPATDSGQQFVFEDLPLLDHPLLLTDASAVDFQGGNT